MSKGKKKSERQVVMARAVAGKWLRRAAHSEYRLRILFGASHKNLPNLLRSFRDGKVSVVGVPRVADLGVKEAFDAVEVWSPNQEALAKLAAWAEDKGLETSGVW